MKWYLVALICILLVISDLERHFVFLLAVCISSLEKCLFKSFVNFLTRWFIFVVLGVHYIF